MESNSVPGCVAVGLSTELPTDSSSVELDQKRVLDAMSHQAGLGTFLG